MRKLKKTKTAKGWREDRKETDRRDVRQRGDKNKRNVRDPQSLQRPGEASLINEATDV